MKSYYEIKPYIEQIQHLYDGMDLSFLKGRTLLVSGASGAILSMMIDGLLIRADLNVKIVALAYKKANDLERFQKSLGDGRLTIIEQDLTKPFTLDVKADYVIHGASYTDPKGYASHPIETMTVNFEGTKSMLDLASACHSRFLMMSSCEIYGENGKQETFENDYGQIDPLNVRSGYNMAKLASETLCVSYKAATGVDIVISRLSRSFGPTTNPNDTKAMTQFLKNAVLGEPISIKSSGTQVYGYAFIGDVCRALILLLEKGSSGEAYNVSSGFSVELKELAKYLSEKFNVNYQVGAEQDAFAKAGYSKVTRSVLNIDKIKKLGFVPRDDLRSSIEKTVLVLREMWRS